MALSRTPGDPPLKVGVLISGRGSNMAALVEACADPAFPAEIVTVTSNLPDAAGLERAAAAGIATQVVDHRVVGNGGSAIEGRILNRGPEARNVLVEAYLYDADGRYIRTARTSLPEVPGEEEIEFRLPLDPAISGRVGRYSMYTGLEPNPYAPDAL